jgi:branched-chain amino acid transport system substrate-binding protein
VSAFTDLVMRGMNRHSSRCRFGRSIPLLLLLAFLPGCGPEAENVVFGLAGPFDRFYGVSMRDGAELARQEINDRGGIGGRMLEFRARDDGADPERGIGIAEELVDEAEVVAVIGHVNSGVMIAAAPVYARGLPAVATSATAPAIGQLSPWVFRVASSDSANAVELARFSRTLGDGTTGILYENNAYGRGLAQSFRNALTGQGSRPLETDPYLENTADFSPFLRRLDTRGAELVFVAGLEEGASGIIRQTREMGLPTRFIGGDGLEGLAGMEGDVYDGTFVGLMYHPDASPAAAEFAERFRATYGREPDSFAALAYDAVMLVARVADRHGVGREAIREGLSRVGRSGGMEAHPGVAGELRFDEHGDPVDKPFAVGVIRGGQIDLPTGGF